MKSTYPTIKVRMAFARARAVLYEDYMAIEHLHSFGMASEDSRTYFDEVRWVMRFQRRDWHRLAFAFLACMPLSVGALFLALGENWTLSTIGLALALPSGLWLLYSLYRLIAIPRAVAILLSPRGAVVIGVDWPRSSNPLKDAGKFFETLLGRLKLVEGMPPPIPPPAPTPGPELAPPTVAPAAEPAGGVGTPAQVEPPSAAPREPA